MREDGFRMGLVSFGRIGVVEMSFSIQYINIYIFEIRLNELLFVPTKASMLTRRMHSVLYPESASLL